MKSSSLVPAVLVCLFLVGCGSTRLIEAHRSATYMDQPCIVGTMQLGWHDRWQAFWTGRVRLMQRPESIPFRLDQSYRAAATNDTQPFGLVFGNSLTWDQGRYGWVDIDLAHFAEFGYNIDGKEVKKQVHSVK